LPADRHAGVIEKLRGWEQERDEARRELVRLETVAEAGQEYAQVVRVALDEVQKLEERIAGGSPAKVRDLVGRWVGKVTLHFQPGTPLPGGRYANRQRHILGDIEIDFTPEVAHLLPFRARHRC